MAKRIHSCTNHWPGLGRFLTILAFVVCAPSEAFSQGVLTNGGNHAGAISAPAEIDTWTFDASLGDAIALSIGEVLTSEIDPDFRPWIRLRRPDGVEIGSATGLLAAQINITAPLSGTYTVLVRDYMFGSRPGTAVGDYLLHFLRIPGDPIIPGGDDGGLMSIGDNHTGSIHRGDLDPWTFTAAQNDAIIVTIGEVLDSEIDPDFRPWIRLYGPNGVLLDSGNGLLAATMSVTAPLSGTYTVVVADYNFGAREGSAAGDYVLHLVKTPGAITVPDGDDGGPMTNGANHAGRIGAPGDQPTLHRADLDPWTFAAAKDDRIIVTIGEVLDSEIDPDFRPWIRLYGPNGVLLASGNGLLAATMSATAPLSGTYTVVVADYDFGAREGSAVGDYVLHLVKTPGAFVVPDGDDGGTMTDGVNHPGRIGAPGDKPTLHRADLDVWTFLGAQGNSISVTIAEVLPAGPDPDFQPWIRLFSPTGTLVRSGNGLLAASINFNAPFSGQYTVIVADYSFGAREGFAVGDYTIRVDGAINSPTSITDSFQTAMGTTLTVPAPGVLANDNTNGGGPMTAVLASPVTSGSLALAPNGAFVYTPAAGFTGSATFTYRAQNSAGPGNVATVTIAVTSVPPTTTGDAFGTISDTPLNVPAPGVLANDAANGGGALTAELVGPPANGTVHLAANGGFNYTPNPGFAGVDSFSYRAVSSVGPGNIAVVTITVDTLVVQPPTDLYVASVVGNTVTIRWTPPVVGPAPTTFVLEGGVGPGATQASIVMGLDPVYTFQAPNGAFFIRVHTFAGAERSEASNEVRLFVNVPVPPSAPANLLGLVNDSSLGLAWRNTFGGAAPHGLILDVTGALTTSIPLGLTDTFAFSGVPPGTYTFSLRAVNAAGVSASSHPVTLTFPAPCSGAPAPPENFVAYRVGNTINVLWDPAASGPAPSGFVLGVTGTLAASIPTPTRALSGGVGPGSYTLSVMAVNACGNSASTSAQTVVVP